MKCKYLLLLLLPVLFSECNKSVDYEYRSVAISNLPLKAQIVATGNLSGNKQQELICGSDSTVQAYSIVKDSAILIYEHRFNDQILKIVVGNVDSDRKNELIIVTGQPRYKETDVKVYVIEAGERWSVQEVYSKFSKRPMATSLQVADSDNDGVTEVLVSYFESKYIIESVSIYLSEDQWQAKVLEQRRMAMTRRVGVLPGFDGNQQVVGRVYGDEIGMAGDAYLLAKERIMLPAKRGVKAVQIGDADNDGINDILLGDGWHQDYGKIARARLAIVHIDGGQMVYELIEDVKNQYEVTQIEVADINEDGLNEVLAKGNRFTRIYQKDKVGWNVFRDTLFKGNQFAIGDITGDKRLEVIFSGKEIGIYNFGQIPFLSELDPEIKTVKVYPDSLIGQPAPELSITKWYNGSFPGLYNSKGKVVLLDFWATWCKPCIKTFPDLAILQKKYADQGFQIIGLTKIDRSQSEEEIADFVKNQGFLYPIGLSNETLNNLAYGVGAIPHAVLIDKTGKVRWYKVGTGNSEELEKELKKLLAE